MSIPKTKEVRIRDLMILKERAIALRDYFHDYLRDSPGENSADSLARMIDSLLLSKPS